MIKIYSVVVLAFLLNLTGCYTIVWTPGMDNTIPSDTYAYDDSTYYNGNSNNISSNSGDSSYEPNSGIAISVAGDYFYDPHYYGAYTQYYHHPWWLSYAAPKPNKNNPKREPDKTTGAGTGVVRNSGDGRGDYGRNTGSSTGTIINNAPPTVSTGSSSSGSNSPTNGSANTNSRQSTTNSTDNKSDNSAAKNASSGSVRNNDGDRNDGGRK